MFSGLTLTLVAIVGFAIAMYVLLDGFDLGVGILFPWVNSESYRDVMIDSIAPVWDGNETWLVLGGATLYAAFPVVYSTLLPTLYLPLFLMLIALVFRGVSFEFRHLAKRGKFFWNSCFFMGSIVAAFCQGLVLATFVQGYMVVKGNPLILQHHPFSLFNLFVGFAVVIGYALLGATWLIHRTVGELQQLMKKYAKNLLIAVGFFAVSVTIWTPLLDHSIAARWFSFPSVAFLAPLPLIGLISVLLLWQQLKSLTRDILPFALTIAIFLVSYLGFIASVWPYIIPRVLTVWQASAPPNVQRFILVGLIIILPIILGYTFYSYWLFKEKITEGSLY